MKALRKFYLLSVLLFVIPCFNSLGQIKVFSNNYVGINCSTTPASRFVVNGPGSSLHQVYFYNPNISTGGSALAVVSEAGYGTSSHIMSIASQTQLGVSNYLYGFKGNAISTTALSTGRSYGVYGQAGNATSGYNYSVYGYLYGTNYGAAVFGTINGLGDTYIPGQYAGYFRGNVKCENIMYASAFAVQSDEKFKTNIQDLSSEESLKNISKIIPKKYNLKQIELTQVSADTSSVTKYFNESDQLFIKVKYGVLAQDLQKIFPELVYQDGDGNLSVDYIGLIPLTIKAVQAQQDKITVLEERIAVLTKQLEELNKQ